ncbi:MAG TPA: ABC transporter substrate-binding protein [Thermomicrobiales bacterium]|nr:ABC transporter substrate-binding protein [Thermomicrobiales bacterium]
MNMSDAGRARRSTALSRRTLLRGAAAAGVGVAIGGRGSWPTARAAAQANGDVAIFTSAVDIPNIDPAIGHDGAIATTQKHVYDTLYRHTGNPPQLVPWLATAHQSSPDAKTWTFTLDERAKFQDGSPVTADAIVFSTQRLLKLNQGVAWMFADILHPEGMTAVDPKTVKFTLAKPFAPFLHATTWLFVLNPAVVKANEKNGDQGQAWLTGNAAGSGPFKISRWEPGNLYQFDADPNYWKGWEGDHVAGYVHQVSQESSTKRLALQKGDAQFADWLSPQDKTLLEKIPTVVVPKEKAIETYTIKMNNKVGPTADVNVRRALSYAFDYNAMLDVMSGFAARIAGPLSPALAGALAQPAYETDLAKAKAELAKSTKYADGFDIDFVYVTGLEEERQTGQILLDQLKALNINVKITAMEWANAVALFADPKTSPALFPIYSASDYPDPDAYLWSSYHSSSAGTWMGADQFADPNVDAMLQDARSTTDEAKRADLYAKIQQTIVDQAVELFLFTPLRGVPHRKEVQGYSYCPVMGSDPWWYKISLGAA